MDIKDSYLHGTVGVVKSISVSADTLKYILADIAGTVREVTLPVATQTANGLLSKEDKKKLDNMIATKVANDLILKINSGTTEGTSLYTYNGSAAKTLDIKLGSNITLKAEANSLTINASDTKVTLTNTTDNASYRVLFSGNANDTTETTTARKSANLLFNPSIGKLTVGHLSTGGDIIFTGSNKDQYLYYYHNDAWAWRTGHQGTGTSDTNYFVIQNQVSGTVTTSLKIDYNAASKATFIGTVVAPTFQGNLDGTYVNKLTGYTKATSASSLAATDTLNAALGKLEYKADVAYDLVTKANDSDGTIENLKEILDVLAGIKDTETIQALVGKYLPLAGGTMNNGAIVKFNNTGGLIQTSSTTNNAVSFLLWYKGSAKDANYSYAAQIGWHNTGNTDGAIYLVPNPQNTEPWGGSVGLYIGKTLFKWNNKTILHSGNYTSYTPILNNSSTHATSSSVIYAPSTAGTKGLVLTSNGSGAPVWSNSVGTANNGIFYIEGTGTTAGTWLGSHTGIASYYTGLTIAYKIPIAGASTTKLNINSLGAVTCYINTSKLTTHYGVGATAILVYDGTYFRAADYWDGNNYAKVRLYMYDSSNNEYPLLFRYATTATTTYVTDYTAYDSGITINPSTNNLKGINDLYLTGDISIKFGDSDKFVIFDYDWDKSSGASWRMGVLGSGSSDTNYFVVLSGTSTTSATAWNNAIRIGQNTYDIAISGNLYPLVNNTKTLGTSSLKWSNVYATTFTGNLSGNATTATTANILKATTIVSAKEFSLSNASWTDTGYTFASLASGTYAVQVTSGTNLVASGIMSVYKNLSDTAGDEIPLHVYGTAGWRPYLRTYANKLLISSNDASATSRTVTIKIALIL